MKQFPMIQKPKRPTEFELQADLYARLKAEKYDVRGEVSAYHDGTGSRMDLVIFVNGFASVVIEVKDTPHWDAVRGKKTRQRRKYEQYGIPLLYYTPEFTIEGTLKRIRSLMKECGY